MKLKVLQENFSKALSVTSRFANSRAQLPVLANVLISVNKNKLRNKSYLYYVLWDAIKTYPNQPVPPAFFLRGDFFFKAFTHTATHKLLFSLSVLS